MPKRSPGNKNNGWGKNNVKLVDRLNRAVDALLTSAERKAPEVDRNVNLLVRLAADLRALPREEFKARLKSELLKGRNTMTTVAEPKAATHTVATPRLTFKSVAQAIEFYGKTLGARETFRFEVPGMGIPHAEIMIGESMIMLSDEWPDGGRFSAETWGHSPVNLSMRVDDVDAFVAHAVAGGMKTLRPIRDEFYGYREGDLIDPFGYAWHIFTVKEEMSVEEMHRRFRAAMGESKKPAVDPVPRGFHTVTPYMIAPEAEAMLGFAKQAFEAEETFRIAGEAGGIHAETRIGDSMLMMGGGISGKPFSGKPNTTALHIYVEDTDAVYKKALQAGATSIGEPQDHEYGERGAGVKDPFGNFWYIATHKGESHIPKGLHNVNVYMHPLRAEPVIGFLKRAFGAHELAKYASPDGVIAHAEIRVGDSVVEMGEAHGPYQPMHSMFYLYVPDCDAVYKRALAAGAKSIQEPVDHPYGDRSGGVTDPFGNTWYIATHVKDM